MRILYIALSLIFTLQLQAQDTMYVAKKFGGILKIPVDNIDSIFFYKPYINTGTVTDIDSNTYKTITIANKVWMAENLRVTTYNDGTPIVREENSDLWRTITTPIYSGYRNSIHPDTIVPYGNIYNWHVVNTQKICPVGWHVFSNEEWNTMIETLGSIYTAGNILKAKGTDYWQAPNDKATDAIGFKALPSGFMYHVGVFSGLGTYSYWWTTDAIDEAYSRSVFVSTETYVSYFDGPKYNGYAIRCVKN